MTPRQRILVVVGLVAALIFGAAAYLTATRPQLEKGLVIYGPRGISDLGRAAAKEFSATYGVNATFFDFGMGSIEIVNKIIEERQDPKADIVFGLPEFYAKPIFDRDILLKFNPPNLNEIPKENQWDQSGRIVPLDQGHICILYNSTQLNALRLLPPETFEDLLKPQYKGLVVYNSPVTSGTGLSVLTWVLSEKGEEAGFAYLKNLKNNLAPVGYPSGFSALVRAMKSGQGAIVLSFTSHAVDPSTPHMKAVPRSCFVYREGVAIVKGSKNVESAKKFIEFTLGKQAQELADRYNFMYPIRSEAKLSNLVNAPVPERLTFYNPALGGKADAWRERWRTEILGA